MTLSRRNFLRTAALATLAFPAVVRARNLNSQIQIAAVGVDGKGYSDIDECASHTKARFVGLCDIDAGRFAKIDKRHPGEKVLLTAFGSGLNTRFLGFEW